MHGWLTFCCAAAGFGIWVARVYLSRGKDLTRLSGGQVRQATARGPAWVQQRDQWMAVGSPTAAGLRHRGAGLQAEQLRTILTDLGPAFVKIGQVGPKSALLYSTC